MSDKNRITNVILYWSSLSNYVYLTIEFVLEAGEQVILNIRIICVLESLTVNNKKKLMFSHKQ
jgi:hypothetical protein